MPGRVPGQQQGHHRGLRRRHHPAGEAGGAVGAEPDRQRADAGAPVALHRLEVVEGHDAVGAQAVEGGEPDDPPVRQGAAHHGGTGEPGQALVAEAASRVAPPAVALQPHRRRAVEPGERQPEHACAQHPGPEQGGDRERDERPGDRHVEAPAARDAAGGNRPVRLVDGVDVPVEPVVRRLAGGADEGAGEQDAGDRHGPAPLERGAGGDHPAGEGPHRREPRDRLQQFQERTGLRHRGRRDQGLDQRLGRHAARVGRPRPSVKRALHSWALRREDVQSHSLTDRLHARCGDRPGSGARESRERDAIRIAHHSPRRPPLPSRRGRRGRSGASWRRSPAG